MSLLAMSWAWEQDVPAGLKLTLLAIADAANDSGYGYPGQTRLAVKCNCSERQIRRNVRQLEGLGLLAVMIRPGAGEGRHSNGYQLAMNEATGHTCPDGATGHLRQGNRTSEVGQPDIAMSAELKKNRKKNRQSSTDAPLRARPTPGARRLPTDWQPGDKARRWIEQHGLTVDQAGPVIHEFVAYWQQRSTRRKDWDLAFMRNGIVQSALLRIKNHATRHRTDHPARPKAGNAFIDGKLDAIIEQQQNRAVGSGCLRQTAGDIWEPVDEPVDDRAGLDDGPRRMASGHC